MDSSVASVTRLFTASWAVKNFTIGAFSVTASDSTECTLVYEDGASTLSFFVNGKIARFTEAGADGFPDGTPVCVECENVQAVLSASDKSISYVKLFEICFEVLIVMANGDAASEITEIFHGKETQAQVIHHLKPDELLRANRPSLRIDFSDSPARSATAYTAQLWTTRSWSDITVKTAGREFAVHKSVICLRSDYFGRACKPEFQEGSSNTIILPELDYVIEVLLRHLYGLGSPIFDSVCRAYWYKSENERISELATLFLVYQAAEKYAIDDLALKATRALALRIKLADDAKTVVYVAQWVFNLLPDHVHHLREAVIEQTVENLETIMLDPVQYRNLLNNDELTKCVFGQMVHSLKVKDRQLQLATPPSSPPAKKRKKRMGW